MKNMEVADIFDRIADILEFKGDNVFRVSSYRKAAMVLRDLTEDIEGLYKSGRLMDIPGIGKGMMEKIAQYLEKGKIDKYEEIKKDVPEGVIEMLQIPGLGPKTVALAYEKLRITSINELEEAAKSGQLRKLPGMGQKKEENILRGIRLFREASARILLGIAYPIVEEIVDFLKKKGIELVSSAGSLRRMKETIGDIDILVGTKKGEKIIKDFVSRPNVKEVLAAGQTKGSVIVEGGIQIDIRVVDPSSYGSALQYFTGSKAHNIHLREIAKQRGLKINEYGVFRIRKGREEKIAGETEEEVYNALDLPWIPPTLREDRGEIESAMKGQLPTLIEMKDIKSDLHVHSSWSDGSAKIEEIVRRAKELGYEYIAITDHSQAVKIAGGLTPERLKKQIKEIRELNTKLKGITVLAGSEVDIKNDGSMDFPDEILAELDIVIGSIHSGFKQSKEQITNRIIKAMKNPYVNVIGHPSGRLIGSRDPYAVDMEKVIKAAKETGTALEINSYYDRLDLDDLWTRKAAEMGVYLSIGTDAHHVDQLWMMRLGVGIAQRGWLEKKNVLNTHSLKELKKILEK